MSHRWGRDLAISAALFVLMAGAVIQALSFNSAARMLPLLVGVPTTAVLAAIVVRDVRRRPSAESAGADTTAAGDPSGSAAAPDARREPQEPQERDRSARPLLTLTVLAVSWVLFGYAVGAAALSLWFMRWLHRESWRTTLVATAGLLVFLRGALVEVLGIAMYRGLLARYVDFF